MLVFFFGPPAPAWKNSAGALNDSKEEKEEQKTGNQRVAAQRLLSALGGITGSAWPGWPCFAPL